MHGLFNFTREQEAEVINYIMKAKTVLEQIDAETPVPDMSNCMPS